MSTTIRPEVSEKNEFWISKHRYYELIHFCLQYEEWKKAINTVPFIFSGDVGIDRAYTYRDRTPVEITVERRERYKTNIELLEWAAKETDDILGEYVLLGVTKGLSYDKLRAKYQIPCGKDMYYKLYRKFLWLLDQKKV